MLWRHDSVNTFVLKNDVINTFLGKAGKTFDYSTRPYEQTDHI